jgi:hypothetical protein
MGKKQNALNFFKDYTYQFYNKGNLVVEALKIASENAEFHGAQSDCDWCCDQATAGRQSNIYILGRREKCSSSPKRADRITRPLIQWVSRSICPTLK